MNAKRYNFILLLAVLIFIPSLSYAVCTDNEDGDPGQNGEIEFFTTDNELSYCDGAHWIRMIDLDDYFPNPISLDGSSSSINNASTVKTATKQWTASFWLRPVGAAENAQILLVSGGELSIRHRSSNSLLIVANDNTDGTVLRYSMSSGSVPRDDWLHVLFSFDATDSGKAHIYVNDVDVTPSGTHNDLNIDLTSSNYAIGSNASASGQHFNGDIADFWMDFDTYIDLSVEANRRKFIDASGNPVFMGLDGSLPTGSTPDIFLSGSTASWHQNKGNMTGFDEVGTLVGGSVPVRPSGAVDASSPFGHWTLDETSGTTAFDSSGNGNDGTYISVDPATNSEAAIVDTGIDFESSTVARVEIPANATLAAFDSITYSAWVKSDNFSGYQGVVSIGDGINLGEGVASLFYRFGANALSFRAAAWNGSVGDWRVVNQATAGEWYHLIVTYSYTDPVGTAPKFYINGEEVTVISTVIAPSGTYVAPATATFHIGNVRIGSIARSFNGVVDDVRVFDRVLSPAEILSLSSCSGPGTYFYNPADDVMQWCTSPSMAINMHTPAAGIGGCTTPTASEGALNYDTDRYKACDGNGWLDIGK